MEKKLYTDLLQANRICKEAAVHTEKAAQLRANAEALAPVLKKKKTKSILLGIGGAYLVSMVAALPAAIPYVGPILFVLLNIAGMAAGAYLGITCYRRDKAEVDRQLETFTRQAAAEEAAARKLFDENEEALSFLPCEYWDPDATGYMLRALQSGRTQELAAAMDLYDEYRHRRSLEETNRQLLMEQKTQTGHLKSIQTSSKVSATANVANTVFNIASRL